MNKKVVDVLFIILTVFVIARNVLREEKTTWNYMMIGLGIVILASQAYRYYTESKNNS